MEYNSIILRYGEVGIKSDRNRKYFETLYLSAINQALNNFKDVKIISFGKRFIIHHPESYKFISILKKIPGIQSFSPAKHFTFSTKDDLIKNINNLTHENLKNKTFRVTTKRTGKHDFSSMQLSADIGEELLPYAKNVDLINPQVHIYIEIRDNNAYLYTESFNSVGGLPPASAGRVLCLFSGGIDSPVAAYEMLKRGCSVDFLYINLLGDSPFDEVAKVYNELISNYVYNYVPKFYVVDAENLVDLLKKEVPGTLRQIFLKIIFYKIGELVANKFKQLALVTGEALSQKSSQTVESLAVINSQINFLVLRPLIGLDKIEITKIARELNTFSFSEKVKEYCSLSEGPVTTNPTKHVLTKLPVLNFEKNIHNLIIFKGLIPIDEKNNVSELNDFKIINLSNIEIENSIKESYPEILYKLDSFSNKEKYLILCNYGFRSKDVANHFNKKNIFAKSMSITKYKENTQEKIISCKKQ